MPPCRRQPASRVPPSRVLVQQGHFHFIVEAGTPPSLSRSRPRPRHTSGPRPSTGSRPHWARLCRPAIVLISWVTHVVPATAALRPGTTRAVTCAPRGRKSDALDGPMLLGARFRRFRSAARFPASCQTSATESLDSAGRARGPARTALLVSGWKEPAPIELLAHFPARGAVWRYPPSRGVPNG